MFTECTSETSSAETSSDVLREFIITLGIQGDDIRQLVFRNLLTVPQNILSSMAFVLTLKKQSTPTYGCEAIFINKTNLKELIKTQGNLLKATLGLRRHCHTKPLLSALSIPNIPSAMALQSLKLLKSTLLHNSGATKFYCKLLSYRSTCANTLVDRILTLVEGKDIDILKFVLHNDYQANVNFF